ncbi:RNA-binding protein 34 [Ischnura elegans]|uniref:RNA-binding protein 34 n=1 Tax=Ischnura elegans TaxID=197161 RepID=UPI001ED8856A|nr:RNA-binding protein 34 [Ischnura elegans]
MDFHVGSIADLINSKTEGKVSSSNLFHNVSSGSGKEVHYTVIPAVKRKRTDVEDEDSEFQKEKKNKRPKNNNAANAAKRLQAGKVLVKEKVVNPEEDKRTIFVGNLPCNIKVVKLKKLFKSYGDIESARLRCPPVKDPKIPKRVAAIKKDFHPERTNIVGFVRFSSEEEAIAALKGNGMLYKDHHLRVDLASRSGTHDQKKAVFVGNLHFGAEENDLWKIFESCGDIDSIRIVRDAKTGVGKGFAYVNFKDLSSVELAMKMDGQTLKDRMIRVQRAVKKVKAKKDNSMVDRKRPGKKFNSVANGTFSNKKKFREEKGKFKDKTEKFSPKAAKKESEPKFKRGGEEKYAGKKMFWEDHGEVLERSESSDKVKKKSKLKLKPEKVKQKVNKKSSKTVDKHSFQGVKVDEESKGKVKKKKLSKAELKKQVIAFQLELKKSGITNP